MYSIKLQCSKISKVYKTINLSLVASWETTCGTNNQQDTQKLYQVTSFKFITIKLSLVVQVILMGTNLIMSIGH